MKSSRYIYLVTALLTACGGDGRSTDIVLNELAGNYGVETGLTLRCGEVTGPDDPYDGYEFVNGNTVVETIGETVLIHLPGVNTILEGSVDGDSLQATGGLPLGGLAAIAIYATWTKRDANNFSVRYEFHESSVNGGSCSSTAVGSAER